jgi:hypothetical protein
MGRKWMGRSKETEERREHTQANAKQRLQKGKAASERSAQAASQRHTLIPSQRMVTRHYTRKGGFSFSFRKHNKKIFKIQHLLQKIPTIGCWIGFTYHTTLLTCDL